MKQTAIILTLAAAVSFVACGGKTPPPAPQVRFAAGSPGAEGVHS